MTWILTASITVTLFAAMAVVVGLFSEWPAHETIGALIVCVLFSGLSTIIGRKVLS